MNNFSYENPPTQSLASELQLNLLLALLEGLLITSEMSSKQLI